MISAKVIDELERGYQIAKVATDGFNESVKAQAELHNLDAVALRQFIAARGKDKVGDYRKRADDAQMLLDLGGMTDGREAA